MHPHVITLNHMEVFSVYQGLRVPELTNPHSTLTEDVVSPTPVTEEETETQRNGVTSLR